jgi:hypothetical protein
MSAPPPKCGSASAQCPSSHESVFTRPWTCSLVPFSTYSPRLSQPLPSNDAYPMSTVLPFALAVSLSEPVHFLKRDCLSAEGKINAAMWTKQGEDATQVDDRFHGVVDAFAEHRDVT